MKENENKEPSSTAGAAKGGNTRTEIIGSAVSTAVGEPVAFMVRRSDDGHIFGVYSTNADAKVTAGWTDGEIVPLYLAAPTQVSAPQADELSISRQKLNMAKIDVLMDGARARSEAFRDGVTFGANSLHMKMLELAGAPQASAAQEVRAVPEDVRRALDRMCTPLDESRLSGATAAEDARCMEIIRRHIEGTSTAPAAMDEKGGAK